MGAGSSAEKKLETAQKKIAVVKALGGTAAARGSAGAQVKKSGNSDVYDFVKRTKAEKDKNWAEVSKKPERSSEAKMDAAYDYSGDDDCDNMCPMCRKPTMVGIDGYGCRVCARMFHKPCLQNSGRYTALEMTYVDRARSGIGWSCHECDDICQLLNPDEISRISDEFEGFDINKDSSVSEEEFLTFRKEQYEKDEGTPMPEFELNFEKIQFKSLDADRSGSIDYWEFMKHQASRKLGIKSGKDLVKLLSMSEKRAARKMYETFDTDGDGIIYDLEARMALRSFYSHLDSRSQKSGADEDGTVKARTEPASVATHAAIKADMLMDGDENNDRQGQI